jgi:polyferredoxin
MAAVDVVMPAPPPPAPVVRISRLALAAADAVAVVCLWIASLWVLLASVAAVLIGRLTCGWGCTGAAWTAVLVSLLFVAIVWPLAALLLSKFVEPFYTNQLKKVPSNSEIW